MEASSTHNVTRLLEAWRAGDENALSLLLPIIYDELHRSARRHMAREPVGHILQTTALVNEAYLRLIRIRSVDWQNRIHFFAVSARVMRRILTDMARERDSKKRGGDFKRVTIDQSVFARPQQNIDLLALDEALNRLALIDERKCSVVELRFYGGLDVKETAALLNVSEETVMRDWKLAKVWLFRELNGGKHGA